VLEPLSTRANGRAGLRVGSRRWLRKIGNFVKHLSHV
jgi:hypothetical protein